jgi:hypothetical protein
VLIVKQQFERTQNGNPHGLPIRQHIFPKASISRFADGQGRVWVQHVVSSKVHRAMPDADIFCAMRAWDTRAEWGYMKQIENAFQELAARIINGTTLNIEAGDKQIADTFFVLWRLRAVFKRADKTDVQFNGVTGTRFSHDLEEVLEKAGVYFLHEGGKMPAHRLCGIQLQVGIDSELPKLADVRWGILQAFDGQFLVPGSPTAAVIPLAPYLALCSGGVSGIANRVAVAEINHCARTGSAEYFFAQDLAKCP